MCHSVLRLLTPTAMCIYILSLELSLELFLLLVDFLFYFMRACFTYIRRSPHRSCDEEELSKKFKARPMPTGRSSSVGRWNLYWIVNTIVTDCYFSSPLLPFPFSPTPLVWHVFKSYGHCVAKSAFDSYCQYLTHSIDEVVSGLCNIFSSF